MPRSAIQGAQKLARQLGALFGGQAEQALYQKIAFGTQNFATPTLVLDAPFTFTPQHTNTDGTTTIFLVASFCVQAAAADVAVACNLLLGGSPIAQVCNVDSGGSTNHSASGTLSFVDTSEFSGAPRTYHVRVGSASNLTAVLGVGYLSLFAWELPSGNTMQFS